MDFHGFLPKAIYGFPQGPGSRDCLKWFQSEDLRNTISCLAIGVELLAIQDEKNVNMVM
jgi:hypothetical protein